MVKKGFHVDADTGARSKSLGGILELGSDMIEVIPYHWELRVVFSGVSVRP